MQEEKKDNISAQPELSKIWSELLGYRTIDAGTQLMPAETMIPTVHADPWYALLHLKGVEIIDLQHLRLHISDQDVERLLQVMQEHSSQNPE
jgi:hypothetical protein